MVIFSVRPLPTTSLEYLLPLLFIHRCFIFFKARILADIMLIKYPILYPQSPTLLLLWKTSSLRGRDWHVCPASPVPTGGPESRMCPTGMC